MTFKKSYHFAAFLGITAGCAALAAAASYYVVPKVEEKLSGDTNEAVAFVNTNQLINQPQKDVNAELKTYTSKEYGFTLQYPKEWNYIETHGGALTPFGVLFSDIDLQNWDQAPGKLPGNFVNVAILKTTQSPMEYSLQDAKAKVNDEKMIERVEKNGLVEQKINDDKNQRLLLSAYAKKSDYLVIIETVVDKNNAKLLVDMQKIFDGIVASLVVNN